MSSDADEFSPEAFLPKLSILSAAGLDLMLVAGQSVNVWASFFAPQNPELLEFLPFTSKDVDLFGTSSDFQKISEHLSGRLHRYTDIRQPLFGVFTLTGSPAVKFDLLRKVYGPVPGDRLFSRARTFNGIPVIDPVSLLISKAHNVADLDQRARHDLKHFKMLTIITNAYFSLLYRKAGIEVSERQIIREIRFLCDFAADRKFQSGLALTEKDLEYCLDVSTLRECSENFPKLKSFLESTLLKLLRNL